MKASAIKNRKYVFNAVFIYADDGISIEFLDLPGCISCVFTTKEALKMAKEALELYLDGMKEEEIPTARKITDININNTNEKIFPIEAEVVTK